MRIVARAPCHPTENKEKVKQALLNMFPEGEVEELEGELIVRTASGERFRQLIIDHHIRDTARSVLLRGVTGDRTFFRLNKQVAAVGKLSFAEGAPPLGTIDVEVTAEDMSAAIDHLAESTVEARE